jgi:hypothetical protein
MCKESGTKAAVPFVLVVAFYVVVILYIQQRGDFISAWLIFCSVSSLSHRFQFDMDGYVIWILDSNTLFSVTIA